MLHAAAEKSERLVERRPGWWVIYTRHHHEHSVADLLRAKGLDVFLPSFECSREWKDRRKVMSMPLFPCYLFVRESDNGRLPIVTTPGVHAILSHGVHCAVVPDDEIQVIHTTVQAPSRIKPHSYLNYGERVRVIRGPMRGVGGIFLRRKANCRLIVSVELLKQSVAVEVGAEDVEPVESLSVKDLSPIERLHTSTACLASNAG